MWTVGPVWTGLSIVNTSQAMENLRFGSRLWTSMVLPNLRNMSSIQQISVSQPCMFFVIIDTTTNDENNNNSGWCLQNHISVWSFICFNGWKTGTDFNWSDIFFSFLLFLVKPAPPKVILNPQEPLEIDWKFSCESLTSSLGTCCIRHRTEADQVWLEVSCLRFIFYLFPFLPLSFVHTL